MVESRITAGGLVGGVLRPDGALGDPLPDLLRLGGRERFAFRRHLRFRVLGRDAIEEQGLGRIAGDEGRAGFAALHGVHLGIEAKVSLHFLRSMALHAAFLEEWADLPVEVYGRAQAGHGEQQEGDGGESGHGEAGWGQPFLILLFF